MWFVYFGDLNFKFCLEIYNLSCQRTCVFIYLFVCLNIELALLAIKVDQQYAQDLYTRSVIEAQLFLTSKCFLLIHWSSTSKKKPGCTWSNLKLDFTGLQTDFQEKKSCFTILWHRVIPLREKKSLCKENTSLFFLSWLLCWTLSAYHNVLFHK